MNIKIYIVFSFILLCSCSSLHTNYEFYEPVISDLKNADYQQAENKIWEAEQKGEYETKDSLLLLMDKAIISHYNGKYSESNKWFDKAEMLIEELYTKSVSQAAFSYILNDNIVDYSGEVYENLYINIFKALNFINLKDFNSAYVEVNRINNKLKYYKTMFSEMTDSFNQDSENKLKMDAKEFEYLNNVLANYISFLIFRAEGEYDNSRISYNQMLDAWNTYTDVYNFEAPSVFDSTGYDSTYLNILSFTGTAPQKKAVGARITTFDDALVISDPSNFYIQPIFFPGIKYGLNFKFSFPEMIESGTGVNKIILKIDGKETAELNLLENMNSVAIKTFEVNKNMIFFKTIVRAVAKGIAAGAIGNELQKNSDSFLGDIFKALTNVAFDITENADLRSWRTMPGYCFTGEVKIDPGKYNIEILYLDYFGNIIQKDNLEDYQIKKGLNLIESICLL